MQNLQGIIKYLKLFDHDDNWYGPIQIESAALKNLMVYDTHSLVKVLQLSSNKSLVELLYMKQREMEINWVFIYFYNSISQVILNYKTMKNAYNTRIY